MDALLRDGVGMLIARLGVLIALSYGEYLLIRSIMKSKEISLPQIFGSIVLGFFILAVFLGLFSPASGGGHRFESDDTDPHLDGW